MKYRITCYSPPSQLKLSDGDLVEVEGLTMGDKIRARTIKNNTKASVLCRCGQPTLLAAGPRQLTGKVSNISMAKAYLEFDLIV